MNRGIPSEAIDAIEKSMSDFARKNSHISMDEQEKAYYKWMEDVNGLTYKKIKGGLTFIINDESKYINFLFEYHE